MADTAPQALPENPITGSSNTGPGVTGRSYGNPGVAGYSYSKTGSLVSAAGAVTAVPSSDGVYGEGRHGVHGKSSSTDVADPGVLGEHDNAGGIGVAGVSQNGLGVKGTSVNGSGVYGANLGISGNASGAKPTFGCGVWGDSDQGYGVFASSNTHTGLFGKSNADDGVHGESVQGTGVTGTGAVRGVVGTTTSLTSDVNHGGVMGLSNGYGAGVVAQNSGVGPALIVVAKGTESALADTTGAYNHLAAYFGGKAQFSDAVSVSGALSVSGDTKIDGKLSGTEAAFSGKISANDVALTGADCAEQFDVNGTESIEPGTVLVIDDDGSLKLCGTAYDRRVAGVVSGAGKFKPGLVLDQREDGCGRATVALVGKVYCKVDAAFGAIGVGDMLTSSQTPGHAMRAADPLRAFGSVIGKALQPLASGRGLLPILVALQ